MDSSDAGTSVYPLTTTKSTAMRTISASGRDFDSTRSMSFRELGARGRVLLPPDCAVVFYPPSNSPHSQLKTERTSNAAARYVTDGELATALLIDYLLLLQLSWPTVQVGLGFNVRRLRRPYTRLGLSIRRRPSLTSPSLWLPSNPSQRRSESPHNRG